MRRFAMAIILASGAWMAPATAGEAEIGAARSVIDGQIRAFLADDLARAYSFAAPGIRQLFPTLDSFMAMVEGAYMPVRRPKTFAFGKVEEPSATSVVQQVFLVGPDGKDYEAIYTLELQPDGTWRITGVSLRAATSLST